MRSLLFLLFLSLLVCGSLQFDDVPSLPAADDSISLPPMPPMLPIPGSEDAATAPKGFPPPPAMLMVEGREMPSGAIPVSPVMSPMPAAFPPAETSSAEKPDPLAKLREARDDVMQRDALFPPVVQQPPSSPPTVTVVPDESSEIEELHKLEISQAQIDTARTFLEAYQDRIGKAEVAQKLQGLVSAKQQLVQAMANLKQKIQSHKSNPINKAQLGGLGKNVGGKLAPSPVAPPKAFAVPLSGPTVYPESPVPAPPPPPPPPYPYFYPPWSPRNAQAASMTSPFPPLASFPTTAPSGLSDYSGPVPPSTYAGAVVSADVEGSPALGDGSNTQLPPLPSSTSGTQFGGFGVGL